MVFSGSVEELVGGCGPAGTEEDVKEGAMLCTHRRRVLEQILLLSRKIRWTGVA